MSLKIFRRKGSFVYNYRGTLAPGCRLRGSTGTENREAAERFISEVAEKFYQDRFHNPKDELTFPKAVELYLSAGKPDRFIARLENYWKDTKVKNMTPGAIRQSAIDIFPNCTGATRNRQGIVPVQAIINHCAELEFCPPLKIKRFKVESKIKKPATLEWVDAFCAHATRPDIAALVLFMFGTGARIAEALAVRWTDIDFKARKVLIRQTKLGNQRQARIADRLMIALANLPRDAKPFNFGAYTTAIYHWELTIERAGIDKLTPHSCRHGFATKLLREGIDVITIAKLGGWKSPAHVFQTYGHASDDESLTDRIFDIGNDNGKVRDISGR